MEKEIENSNEIIDREVVLEKLAIEETSRIILEKIEKKELIENKLKILEEKKKRRINAKN